MNAVNELTNAAADFLSDQDKQVCFLGVEQSGIGPIGICTIKDNAWIAFNKCFCFSGMEIRGHHKGFVVVFDEDYWNSLLPGERLWVINHECGHLYYGDHLLDHNVLSPKQTLDMEVRADRFAYFNSELSGWQMYQLMKTTFDSVPLEGLPKDKVKILKHIYFIRLCNASGFCIGEPIKNVGSRLIAAVKHTTRYISEHGFKGLVRQIVKERVEEAQVRNIFR